MSLSLSETNMKLHFQIQNNRGLRVVYVVNNIKDTMCMRNEYLVRTGVLGLPGLPSGPGRMQLHPPPRGATDAVGWWYQYGPDIRDYLMSSRKFMRTFSHNLMKLQDAYRKGKHYITRRHVRNYEASLSHLAKELQSFLLRNTKMDVLLVGSWVGMCNESGLSDTLFTDVEGVA